MADSITLLAQLDGDLGYEDSGAGGTGTGTGALRYREGHDPAVMAALVEEGTTNYHPNPSAEVDASTYSFVGGGTSFSRVTTWAAEGAASVEYTTPGTPGYGAVLPTSASNPAASPGQAWAASFDAAGSGDHYINIVGRNAEDDIVEYSDAEDVTLAAGGSRHSTTTTLAHADITKVSIYFRNRGGAGLTFAIDAVQLEQKDHPTTYCDGSLGDGYAWSGTPHLSASTRTAASISLPLATAPDWVAFRYREAETGAMSFGYVTTLAANNVGTYGSITHDGSSLVIESDRLLVIGPVMAGTGTLTEDNRDVLASTPVWTFGMSLEPPAPPVVNAGPNATVAQNTLWTQAGSFADATGTSWTATVDYGDGGGPVPLALDGVTFTLSHTYTAPGTYTVTVSITDDTDLTGSDTVQVTVVEGPTLGAFTIASLPGTHPTAPRITLPGGGGD